MNRSNNALESMLLSMDLSFKYLRTMEESERTRNACLKYLQNRLLYLYPDNPEILEKMESLAKELGGILSMPEVGWKLFAAKKVLGWRRTIILRDIEYKIKNSIYKSIDKVLYNVDRHKG